MYELELKFAIFGGYTHFQQVYFIKPHHTTQNLGNLVNVYSKTFTHIHTKSKLCECSRWYFLPSISLSLSLTVCNTCTHIHKRVDSSLFDVSHFRLYSVTMGVLQHIVMIQSFKHFNCSNLSTCKTSTWNWKCCFILRYIALVAVIHSKWGKMKIFRHHSTSDRIWKW